MKFKIYLNPIEIEANNEEEAIEKFGDSYDKIEIDWIEEKK